MRYKKIIIIILIAWFGGDSYESTSQSSSEPIDKPNVILIFADDLGYEDLSSYSHPTIHTPRLDRMAYEGIKLTSFYAAASVCTPSRAGLLTGRYPVRIGMPGNLGPYSKGGLSKEERTLAEALGENGYRTAAFGKWPLGAVPGYMPTDRGFDRYFGILYSNDMMPPWLNTQRPLHLYLDNEPTSEFPVDQTTLTKRYTDAAIRVIEDPDERPFFIYLPHSMPHLPVFASASFQNKSKGGRYGDVIEEIDANVGRILDALENQKKDKNTIVIFTSDNGPWRNMPPRMYETEPVEKWHGGTTGPLRGAKATSYEGGYRVPCIIRWSGFIQPGQVNAEIATTMDLHATILKLTRTNGPSKGLDGKDIWPMITKNQPSPHLYYHYFTGSRIDGVRSNEWKIRIAPPASDWSSPELQSGSEKVRLELFNLKKDSYEQFDLSKEYPEIVITLKNEMEIMTKELNATMAISH
ncbi:MAG: arylsulfatase A [Saprospiraceae bacterium]|jgi:arylsulfatase A